jgi:hypothetical protein
VWNASLGVEALWRLGGSQGKVRVGPGLYLVRWTVASDNDFQVADRGRMQSSGSSTWYRQGVGLAAGCSLTSRAELEGRVVFSHYGYENHATAHASLGLLWRF